MCRYNNNMEMREILQFYHNVENKIPTHRKDRLWKSISNMMILERQVKKEIELIRKQYDVE
jgi:hypothetical protein